MAKKLGFFQKRLLKKVTSSSKKKLDDIKKDIENANKVIDDVSDESRELVIKRREEIIVLLLGDKEKKFEGLIKTLGLQVEDIEKEIEDDDGKGTGKFISYSEESLREEGIDQLLDTLSDLIEEMEKVLK